MKIGYSTPAKMNPCFVNTKLDFNFTKSDFNFLKQGFSNALSCLSMAKTQPYFAEINNLNIFAAQEMITINPLKPYFYYLTGHLGSSSYITNDAGQVTQTLAYLPFGEDWVNLTSNQPQYETPYKFNGKEKDEETGFNYYGARYYDSYLSIFLSVDPHSDNYPHFTGYNYCANSPVMITDPNGKDWFEYTKEGETSKSWNWHKGSTYKHKIGEDENGKSQYETLTGHKAVVVFSGSRDEKLGGENKDNLFGDGAVLANVTVYGPSGESDIQNYQGFTMSSDYSAFGAIADGDYTVNYMNPGKGGSLSSNWALNNAGAVDCIDGKNPSPINPYSSTQKNGIYIHRSNNSGFAGKTYKNGKLTGAVSTGCLLIVPSRAGKNTGWDEFKAQLNGVSSFHLRLSR